MPVDSKSAAYEKHAKSVQVMRDVIAGEDAVKARDMYSSVKEYLPGFVPADEDRFLAFIKRANFVNFTGRTSVGLKGAIERKPAAIELPSELEYMRENCDGKGTNLSAFAGQICKEILDTGECGVLLDRPPGVDGNSIEDDRIQGLKSTLALYIRESIINQKTIMVGSQVLPSLVVLTESETTEEDKFKSTSETSYRVLELSESGQYFQQMYNKDKVAGEVIPMTKRDGSAWDHITFASIGAEQNVYGVNGPPLYALAKVNIAHYRNSADYEEACHMQGQPTLSVNPGEMSAEAFNTANPNGIVVGSRRGVVLGNGGKLELIQMGANSTPAEAMKAKEEQMVMIGGRLTQPAQVQKTAEEARINAGAEVSLLNTIVTNVSDAITTLLKDACENEGGNPDDVKFELNREFFPDTMTAEEVSAYIMLADRADIAQTDVRARLRKAGWVAADRTDDDIDEEAEKADII